MWKSWIFLFKICFPSFFCIGFPHGKTLPYTTELASRFPEALKSSAELLIFCALAKSTRKSYSSAFNIYEKFMKSHGVDTLPITEPKLLYFATYRIFGDKPVAYKTLRGNLYGIQSHARELGYDISIGAMPSLQRALKGAKRHAGAPRNLKLPITPETLEKMLNELQKSEENIDSYVIHAAFTTALFGLLRISEFAYSKGDDPIKLLKRRNLSFLPNLKEANAMQLFIPASKADQFRKGAKITIGCRCDANKPQKVCAVHAMKKMLEIFPKGYNDPLFQFKNGQILARKRVSAILKSLCLRINVDPKKFPAHSFRKGGATALARAGVAENVIQILGRWSSQAYKEYIKMSPEELANYTAMI